MPAAPSSRPKPERFTPPNGRRGSEATIALMKTIPLSNSDAKSFCSLRSLVHALEPRPNVVSFASSRAASASPTRKTAATGPKTSSRYAGDCFLDLIVQALQDLFRRKWTELSLRIHWVANLERAHALNELLKEALVNFVRDNESLRCDTGLTGVDRARFDRSAQRRFEVRAWHDDECIAAAQLEHTFLDFTRSCARDSS